MNGLTQSGNVDRRPHLLRFVVLIAAALMLSLSAFSTSAQAAELEADDRARARRLRIARRMGRGGRRAAQGRLPDGDADARPGFGGGRRGDRALDAGFDPGRQDPGGTLLRRVRDHQRRQRPNRRPRTGLHGGVRPRQQGDDHHPERGLHAGGVSGPSGVRRPAVPRRHRRPEVLPRGLRPGLESEVGRRDRRPTAPNEPVPLRHSIRAGRLGTRSRRGTQSRLTTVPSTLPCSGSWPSAAGSTTVEFSAASHVGGLTHYKARFVKLIEQAADATGT